MAKFLTIFNIFAGGASIAGVIYSLTTKIDYLFYIPFIVTLLLSIYVLLVPNTFLERNVKSKIRVFNEKVKPQLIDQSGEFSIRTQGTATIEFPKPFSSIPEIEIINFKNNRYIPNIDKVTIYQVTLIDSSINFLGEVQTYKWIAKGYAVLK